MKKVLFILGLFLISISSVFAQNELESTNSKSCNDFNFTKYNLSVEDTKYLVGLAKYYAKEDIDDIYDMVSFTMNLYESKGKNYSSIVDYIKNSGWFVTKAMQSAEKYNDDKYVSEVKTMLSEGKRTLPNCILEFDELTDIQKITINNTSYDKNDTSFYKINSTLITNTLGADYTFYKFNKNKTIAYGYYNTDALKACNNQGVFNKYDSNNEDINYLVKLASSYSKNEADIYDWVSLMANLYEERNGTYTSISDYVKNSGWFPSNYINMANLSLITDDVLVKVRLMLSEGKRTLPRYIDEADSLDDIEPINTIQSKTDNYQPYLTKISNKLGSKYTFYKFSNGNYLFGYTSEDNRTKLGDDCYTIENITGSINKILPVKDEKQKKETNPKTSVVSNILILSFLSLSIIFYFILRKKKFFKI